ncbi:Uncharacterised protein [Vibrio cholerae]|nr:Uncharacterised protein [Vibrio cholerae]
MGDKNGSLGWSGNLGWRVKWLVAEFLLLLQLRSGSVSAPN